MAKSMSIHPASLADMLAEQPETAIAAVCAPTHQSDLSGAEVVEVAELLGIDFAAAPFSAEDLQVGMEVELEIGHECTPSMVDIIDEDLVEIGKIAVINLQDRTDYYSQLTQPHAPGDPPMQPHRNADVGGD
jgi:hypothetical protein